MDPSPLKLEFLPEHKGKPKEELDKLVDQEIDRFSRFMETIGDYKAAGPLTPMERALVKTYIVHRSMERF